MNYGVNDQKDLTKYPFVIMINMCIGKCYRLSIESRLVSAYNKEN